MKQRSQSAFTGSAANPFSFIDLFEQGHTSVVIVGSLFDCKIIPIERVWSGIIKVSVCDLQAVHIAQ